MSCKKNGAYFNGASLDVLIIMHGIMVGNQVTVLKDDGCNITMLAKRFVQNFRNLSNLQKPRLVSNALAKALWKQLQISFSMPCFSWEVMYTVQTGQLPTADMIFCLECHGVWTVVPSASIALEYSRSKTFVCRRIVNQTTESRCTFLVSNSFVLF